MRNVVITLVGLVCNLWIARNCGVTPLLVAAVAEIAYSLWDMK